MDHLSFPGAHSRFAIVAAACLAAAACSDRVPTDPTSALRPSAPSADRLDPTFQYTTIDVPGARGTSPQGINASGDIAGIYTDMAGRTHGFVLHDGAFTTIDYPGADYTDVRGIGPDGDVVGTHAMNNEEAVAFHGFRRTADGQFTDVHFPGHLYEIPQRILPDGTILGCRHDHDLMASMRGIRINGDDATEIDAFASMSNGATPSGHRTVGLYTNMMVPGGRREAFIIDDGVFTPFVVPGGLSSAAWDINPRGDIVGAYRDAAGGHGFVRTDGEYTTLDYPGTTGTTSATGINARGDVVGQYSKSGHTHGFLAVRQ
jgi:uncharacterized membrane protein